jgi:sec-independent protein translocase protein TatA
MPNLGAPELIVLALVLVVLFGWKKLPDMARSLGRSARVFKSEVNEMKQDGKTGTETSEAAQTTVQGDVVNPVQTPTPTPAQQVDPTRDQSPRGDGPAV